MTTYAEDRARRIAEGPTGRANYNGKFSRQVRRQHKRDEEREPVLTHYLTGRLGLLQPEQGLFFTRSAGFRQLIPGDITERRKPSADYTDRYKALFPVLPGA